MVVVRIRVRVRVTVAIQVSVWIIFASILGFRVDVRVRVRKEIPGTPREAELTPPPPSSLRV